MTLETQKELVSTAIYTKSEGTGSFILGDQTSGSIPASILIDGQTYGYTVTSDNIYEVGKGVYSLAGRILTREVLSSSATDNAPVNWPQGTLVHINAYVPVISRMPIEGGSGGGGSSDVSVLDNLGESKTDAISQRAATDALKTKIGTIADASGIASIEFNSDGNLAVTDNAANVHVLPINSVSGDAQTPTDTLYSITNYYVAKDGSLIARDSNGKLWSVPDKDYVTKAIADASGGSTNTTYATTDLKNVTDGTFQARKLSTQQIIDALGFTPLGSDADLSKYAEKDLSNVSAQTIQSLEFVSKQITDALGYVPAKQIDANGLALTDLSNVSIDTFNKKLNFPVSGEDPTVTSGGANNNNKGIRNLYAKVRDKTDTSQGSIIGGIEYTLWALTNSSYGTESSHKIQILTREQVEYLIKNGGGSSVALVQDINGTSTTAAPSQNAVKTGTINAGKNPATASISGWNSDAGAQSVYRILYRTSATHASSEKYGVRVYGDPNEAVAIDLASIAYLQQYAQPKGTYLTSSNIVQNATGTSTVNAPSQAAVNVALTNATKGYVSGMNGGDYSVQGIYAHNTGSGTTVGANENITVKYTNWGGHNVTVELATQPWIQAYYIPTTSIVQTTGTSTTNILSQKAIADNYALKTSVTAPIDNLNGNSTTAAPSQNAVATALKGYLPTSTTIAAGMPYNSAISGYYKSTDGEYQSTTKIGTIRGVQSTYNKGYTVQVTANGFGETIDPISLTSRDEFLAEIKALQDRVAALEAKG